MPARTSTTLFFCSCLLLPALAQSQSVPTEIQLPGTQPGEIGELESPNKCDNCHGGYDLLVEPVHSWRGSMMAHATRDPLFWATVAVAEQDFSGSGDLCIRCHSPEGWFGGRSTPTDGSGLREADSSGVMCDACHQMVDPDDSEHLGIQQFPFLANDAGLPPEGYYGNGMSVMWSSESEKLGPYSDVPSSHQSQQSLFHRSADFCGTCHDVSNPAVGDLAHNNGARTPLAGGFSGELGSPVEDKAAFNHFPYEYGVVERTFSEHASGLLSQTRISDYANLPPELQDGSIERARDAAVAGSPGGDYVDGAPRTFSCQACHLSPVTGKGCNKASAPVRTDLPLHDMTGGNYWVPEAIQYLDGQNKLVLGGGLSPGLVASLDAGATRAKTNLANAASLSTEGNLLRVNNLTGHKLPTGFPEGRRMWLNVKWYGALGVLLREDGAYGPLSVLVDGVVTQVDSLLDLHDQEARIYEAHLGMTQEWAGQLIALGISPALPLGFDRLTGAVDFTLGALAAQAPGTSHETFHFVLNNVVLADNRITPYGMSYDEAELRNALPVPADQYGDPGVGGTYRYWDEVALDPPKGAVSATIDLLYQPTSWEYIQFVREANTGAVTFLATTGDDILEAWQNTGMAAPEVMASASWTPTERDCNANGLADHLDVLGGSSPDCNGNGRPDECDIARGTSLDIYGAVVSTPSGLTMIRGNGVPDECEETPFELGLRHRSVPRFL